MGVFLCKDQDFYEIKTAEQSVFFLALAVVYLVFEVYFIIQGIIMCRNGNSMLKNPMFILFYFCIHVLFIRSFLVFIGGSLVCYSYIVHSIMAYNMYVIKSIIIYIMIFQIIRTLSLSYEPFINKFYYKYIIIVVAVLDLTLYTLIDILFRRRSENSPVYSIYCFISTAFLCLLFNCTMHHFKNFFTTVVQAVIVDANYKPWLLLSVALNSFFVCRIAYEGIDLTLKSLDKYRKVKYDFWYGLFLFAYYSLTEVFTGLIIFYLMNKGGAEGERNSTLRTTMISNN